jgi:hypothetical protein
MIQNKIVKKITYKKSVFEVNSKQNISCCIVIPFDVYNFKNETLAKANQYSEFNVENCRRDNHEWAFDEIMIEKSDYKKLLKKSNKLRLLYALNNDLNSKSEN